VEGGGLSLSEPREGRESQKRYSGCSSWKKKKGKSGKKFIDHRVGGKKVPKGTGQLTVGVPSSPGYNTVAQKTTHRKTKRGQKESENQATVASHGRTRERKKRKVLSLGEKRKTGFLSRLTGKKGTQKRKKRGESPGLAKRLRGCQS